MTSVYTSADIVRLGQELYERDIRPRVEMDHKGQFLALNVETGQYSMAADSLAALQQAKAEKPDAPVYLLRVGFPTAVKIGADRRTSRA